jgi:hypothetical protein
VLGAALVFQQAIGITVSSNCAPVLADLFLHAQEAYLRKGIILNLFQIICKIVFYQNLGKECCEQDTFKYVPQM